MPFHLLFGARGRQAILECGATSCTLYTSRNQQDRTEPQAQRFLRTVSGRGARRMRASSTNGSRSGTRPTRYPSADGPQKALRLRLCRTSARTAILVSRCV